MLRVLYATCFFLALSVGTLSVAQTATDDELRGLWRAGDLKRMEEIARTGDHRAQAWMGLMLQNRTRYQEALHWWVLAAEQGNSSAISSVARMHRHGLGTPKDEAAAVAWYRRGAELGHAESATNLADALLRGLGTARDAETARRWLLSATLWGDRYAPARLARLYADGHDVPRDPIEAYAFAQVANYRLDQSESVEVERLKSDLEGELSAEEQKRARARAVEIVPQLARDTQGSLQALSYVAIALCLLTLAGIFVTFRRIRT